MSVGKKSLEKSLLRNRKMREREWIGSSYRTEKSLFIQEQLLRLNTVQNAKHVMLYVNYRCEVETYSLFAALHQINIKTCAPRTSVNDRNLIACLISNPNKELEPGYQGILEPDAEHSKQFDPALLDVVLVPGCVFDHTGGRIGYGGGYYDRFLAQNAPQAIRIGLAFETQVIHQVPLMKHDIKMHYLVTENKIRQCNG